MKIHINISIVNAMLLLSDGFEDLRYASSNARVKALFAEKEVRAHTQKKQCLFQNSFPIPRSEELQHAVDCFAVS